MSARTQSSRSAVVMPGDSSEVVIVMPGVWPTEPAKPVGLAARLRRRLLDRWPSIKRSLPRDLALLLLLFVVTRHVGVAWVMTDSVNKSMVLVLKGAAVRPGELAVFSYTGSAIPGYYPATWWSEILEPFGWSRPVAGPARGDGFVKYLLGVPGDRIEVDGRQVWLVTPRGRFNAGLCKTHTRNGVPLQPVSPQVIPPGHVYMWAPHADALDSRYAVMGLVPANSMSGKAVPLW